MTEYCKFGKMRNSMKNRVGLRIVHLGHKRIPSREGGVEIVVEELSTRMVKRGCSVTCYNRSGYCSGMKQKRPMTMFEYKGVRLKNVPTWNRKGFAAMTSSIFGAIFSAFSKADIVHFHAEGPAFMCWLPKLLGKKVIVTIHGLDWKREKWGKLASMYIFAGEKMAVKFADEIIVLSEGVKSYFMETYKRKTNFIPNGVERPESQPAKLIIQQFGLEKDSYILFLGRIVPEKGIKYLIKAFKEVSTDKKLVIAGGASDTDDFLREMKNLAQDDERIIFTGFVEGRLLEELYSNAYVYTLPSDLEGMPLSLLEAMSYGNCCLVSNIAECVEVVENKAVTFSKSNYRDLRVKLQKLCDCEYAVQKYKIEASDFICNKYNWEDVTEKTLELYYL